MAGVPAPPGGAPARPARHDGCGPRTLPRAFRPGGGPALRGAAPDLRRPLPRLQRAQPVLVRGPLDRPLAPDPVGPLRARAAPPPGVELSLLLQRFLREPEILEGALRVVTRLQAEAASRRPSARCSRRGHERWRDAFEYDRLRRAPSPSSASRGRSAPPSAETSSACSRTRGTPPACRSCGDCRRRCSPDQRRSAPTSSWPGTCT